jgi:hypothetical protein
MAVSIGQDYDTMLCSPDRTTKIAGMMPHSFNYAILSNANNSPDRMASWVPNNKARHDAIPVPVPVPARRHADQNRALNNNTKVIGPVYFAEDCSFKSFPLLPPLSAATGH